MVGGCRWVVFKVWIPLSKLVERLPIKPRISSHRIPVCRVTWISCSGGWGFKTNSSSIRIAKVREEGDLMFELIGVRNECG